MVKQKMVVKLPLADAKMRSKALKTAVSLSGVQSVAVDGEKLVVVGEVDSVTLTTELRKKMRHHVELVSVAEAKKEEEKKETKPTFISVEPPFWPHNLQCANVRDPYYDSPGCTVM